MAVALTNSVPFRVNEDENGFSWKTSDNKKTTLAKSDYFTGGELFDYKETLQIFNDFSTEKNPDITQEELAKLKIKLAHSMNKINKGFSGNGFSNLFLFFDKLLDIYSNRFTDGDENITPKEQAEIMDIFTDEICNYHRGRIDKKSE